MNAKSIIALTVLAFAGSAAMAQEAAIDTTPFAAAKSRAEVRAEVLKSRSAAPSLVSTEVGDQAPTAGKGSVSTLTREQVRAELRKAPRLQHNASFSAA